MDEGALSPAAQYASPTLLIALATALAAVPLFLYSRRLFPYARQRTLAGRHVWVVGSSRGLGRATALQFAAHGATVSISARTELALRSLAEDLGPNLGALVTLDVTAAPSVLRAALDAVESVAPVDILIANAGINHSGRPFCELALDKIDSVIDTNFRSTARIFSLLLPRLTHRGGTLCAISSLAAYRGVPGASVYAASKAAVTTMCQALSVELYASKVNVVCIHPGFVDTPAIKDLHHPKPFLLGEEAAAAQVLRAVILKAPHYGFPCLMEAVVMRFSRLLPTSVYNFLLHHTS